MYSLGIDAGYSSVKVALMRDGGIVRSEYALHRGKIRECLLSLLERTGAAEYAARMNSGAATGSGAKFLFRYGIAHVNEVTALVEGTKLLAPHCNSIVEIGGEGAKFVGGWKEETERVFRKGMEGFLDFEKRAKENAKNEIAKIAPDEKVFVIISKIYGMADPVLNLGIPGKLMEMGYRTLSFFDLPEGDISGEHPNMYWPFGQHILEPVKLIREHPNMYAVFLTHHCCGPDSMLLHYFRELAGEKPYLNIEVDEHSSSVGVLTRIEAFINSLSGRKTHVAAPVEEYVRTLPSSPCRMLRSLDELGGKTTVFLPFLYPYSSLLEALLRARSRPGGVAAGRGGHRGGVARTGRASLDFRRGGGERPLQRLPE